MSTSISKQNGAKKANSSAVATVNRRLFRSQDGALTSYLRNIGAKGTLDAEKEHEAAKTLFEKRVLDSQKLL